MSNKVIVTDPSFRIARYGGLEAQETYAQRQKEAVKWGIWAVTAHLAGADGFDGDSLAVDADRSGSLFFTLMDGFAQRRHSIALDTGTLEAEDFGKPRFLGSPSCTSFRIEDNNTARVVLGKMLAPVKRDFKCFYQKEYSYDESFHGVKMVHDFQIMTQQDLNDREYLAFSEEKARKLGVANKNGDTFLTDNKLMTKVKKKYPAEYESLMMQGPLVYLFETYPSFSENSKGEKIRSFMNMKSIFYLDRITMHVPGHSPVEIGKYLGFTYQTLQRDPIERMSEYGRVIVIHQEGFKIMPTLRIIAQIFDEVIAWDRKTQSLEELTFKVSLIRYMYSFCMPHHRGDGAIGDWFERTIYGYHGIDMNYNEDALPCFETLMNPSFAHYANNVYPNVVQLKDEKAMNDMVVECLIADGQLSGEVEAEHEDLLR